MLRAELRLEVRDRLVEIARVDRSEYSTQRGGARPNGSDGPDEARLFGVHGLEAMVVVNPDCEEAAHPLPSARRVVDLHPKRRANTAGEAKGARRSLREQPRRFERDPLDVLRPRRPILD